MKHGRPSDLVSIGAMIEHICLEAGHLGLGSLWIRDTVYTEAKIAQAVGYPDLRLNIRHAIGKQQKHQHQDLQQDNSADSS